MGVSSGMVITLTAPVRLPANWRLVHGFLIGPRANLSGANLSGADLSGVVSFHGGLDSPTPADANQPNPVAPATESRADLARW